MSDPKSRGRVTPEELDWAITTFRRMMATAAGNNAPFNEEEKKAMVMLGCAAWAADIEPDDPRLADLPDAQNLVKIMAGKRVTH